MGTPYVRRAPEQSEWLAMVERNAPPGDAGSGAKGLTQHARPPRVDVQ